MEAKEFIEKLERFIENNSDAEAFGKQSKKIELTNKEAEFILQSLQSSEWVSVEERLPEPFEMVLVWGILNKEVGRNDDKPSIGLVEWNVTMASDCKDTDQYSMWYTQITHWKPLTPPNI